MLFFIKNLVVPIYDDNGKAFIEKYTCGDRITLNVTFTCFGHYFHEKLLYKVLKKKKTEQNEKVE